MPAGKRRDRGDFVLDQRTDHEPGAVADGAVVGGGHGLGRHVVDHQTRPRRRVLLLVCRDESIAYRDAEGLAAPRQRQQQGNLIGIFRGHGDLRLRGGKHAQVGGMLRKLPLPRIERRGGARRIAFDFHGDRSQVQPSGDDGIGLGRRLHRRAAFGGGADPAQQLVAIAAQRRGIAQEALALDERTRALDRMTGEEGASAANPIVVLRLLSRGGHGDLIELADRAGRIVFGKRNFGGHQRTRRRQFGARLRRDLGERLLGGCDIAGGNPLLGAQ